MKTANEITQHIIDNALASTNEELENQFEFFAGEDDWTDKQIADALKSPWFPWFKNPAAVALGKLGGSRNTPAQNEARKANAQFAGRPKGSKNKPKKISK